MVPLGGGEGQQDGKWREEEGGDSQFLNNNMCAEKETGCQDRKIVNNLCYNFYPYKMAYII